MLRAGMGEAAVRIPAEFFPNPKEKYTGVHDDPLVHVLILEDEKRYAFLFMNQMDPAGWDSHRERVAKLLGIPAESVLLHVAHAKATPHTGREQEYVTEREIAGRKGFFAEVERAVDEAAAQALREMTEATVGIGYAKSRVNVSRVLQTPAGWITAANEEGETDHTVPVLCIRSASGEPIGVVYNVNTSPDVLENSRTSDGSRLVSGDLAGNSERWLEGLGAGKAVYTTGASADQQAALRAVRETVDLEGNTARRDLGEAGFLLCDILGERLAEAVGRTAEKVVCSAPKKALRLEHRTIFLPGHKPFPPGPEGKKLPFEPGGDVETPLCFLTLGELAMIGCRPEICVSTMNRIRERSPFRHTVMLQFVNGSAGYMTTKDFYEHGLPQSRKGNYAAGAAERFAEETVRILEELYQR